MAFSRIDCETVYGEALPIRLQSIFLAHLGDSETKVAITIMSVSDNTDRHIRIESSQGVTTNRSRV